MAISKLNLKTLCVSNFSSCPFQLILSCFTGSRYGGVPAAFVGTGFNGSCYGGVPAAFVGTGFTGSLSWGGSLPPLWGPASPGACYGGPCRLCGDGLESCAPSPRPPVNKSSTCSKSQLSCHSPLYAAVASPAAAPSRPHPPLHPLSRLRAVSQEPTCPALHA